MQNSNQNIYETSISSNNFAEGNITTIEIVNVTEGKESTLKKEGYVFAGATAEKDGAHYIFAKRVINNDINRSIYRRTIIFEQNNNDKSVIELFNPTVEQQKAIENDGYIFAGVTAEKDGAHFLYIKLLAKENIESKTR
jgi:hypothetical protein